MHDYGNIVYNIGARYFVARCPGEIKELHLKLGKDYCLQSLINFIVCYRQIFRRLAE